MPDSLFAPAFTLWASPVTWLEIVAFVLSLAMVWCNIRVIHWGWPLGIAASGLYGLLFAHSKLYGEAGLQVFFVAIGFWGWWQWARNPTTPSAMPQIRWLSRWQISILIATSALFIGALGLFLSKFTDSDVPWADAVPTALSVVGQVLLGRKFIENWLVWLIVNLLSVGLFAYKGLWLTVLLYAIFATLSWVGWRRWKAISAPRPQN